MNLKHFVKWLPERKGCKLGGLTAMEAFLTLETMRLEETLKTPVKLHWSDGVAFQSAWLEDPYQKAMKKAKKDKDAGSGEKGGSSEKGEECFSD